MADVSIRDLRNHGGEVIDRVLRGEDVIITRGGVPVAQLRLVPDRPLSAATLLDRWRNLPPIDADAFRADVDAQLDTSL